MQLDEVWFGVYLWFANPFFRAMQIHSENKIWGESVEDTVNPSRAIRILCLEAFVSGDETLNSFCTVQ